MMHFFDTYAFIEILNGNPNYEKYIDVEIATTKLNLMEVYYWILRKFGKERADKFYEETVQYVSDLEDDIIKEAMIFRLQNKSKEFSYADCVGYIFSKANGLKFLTGDKQFEKMENVEFVK